MIDAIKTMLSSKKFIATFVAVLVWVLARVGWDVNPDLLYPVIGSLVAFVLAQGWADKGKEAEKVKAAAAAEKSE